MTATVPAPPAPAALDGRTLPVEDPATEETIAHVARGGAAEIDRAVAAARSASRGLRDTQPLERGRALRRLAGEVDAAAEDLARLESLDTRKPLSLARAEVAGCVGYLDYYAGAPTGLQGDTVPLGPGSLAYTVPEPVGVTAHIVPWNAPLSMLCRSVAPALAAGNAAVVKPAEQTPLTALRFADLVGAAGFPDRKSVV